MNGRTAKQLRRRTYKGRNFRIRDYFRRGVKWGGSIVADKFRQAYQLAKKEYYRTGK